MRVLSKLPKALADDITVHHIGGDACPHGGLPHLRLRNNTVLIGERCTNVSDEVLNGYCWHCEALSSCPVPKALATRPLNPWRLASRSWLPTDPHNELMPANTCLTLKISRVGRCYRRRPCRVVKETALRTADASLMEYILPRTRAIQR